MSDLSRSDTIHPGEPTGAVFGITDLAFAPQEVTNVGRAPIGNRPCDADGPGYTAGNLSRDPQAPTSDGAIWVPASMFSIVAETTTPNTDATGQCRRALPITPDKIVKAEP